MIFGVGTDVCEISRVQQVYNRFGDRFVERLLMDEERRLFASTKHPVRFFGDAFRREGGNGEGDGHRICARHVDS